MKDDSGKDERDAYESRVRLTDRTRENPEETRTSVVVDPYTNRVTTGVESEGLINRERRVEGDLNSEVTVTVTRTRTEG